MGIAECSQKKYVFAISLTLAIKWVNGYNREKDVVHAQSGIKR